MGRQLRRRTARAADERLRASAPVRRAMNLLFPDHWSFMLGEIALYSLVVLVVTGTYLTFFFDPSMEHVTYHGRYVPLRGVDMTRAYASTLDISFDVRGGLLIRQVHHWAALLFMAAVFLHMSRVFFTGAFRKPRELNWMIGILMLILCFLEGFTGYTMPDDVLSGASVHIAYGIMRSIPVIGTWLTFMLWGRELPGHIFLDRFYIAHVLLLPGLLLGLVGLHLVLVVRQRHTEPPGRTTRRVRAFPAFLVGAAARFCFVAAVLAGLGGLAQINPIWLYGPYQPAAVSSNSQPDWYMFFLEGALRLFPPWEIRGFGHAVPAVFWPGVVLPTVMFLTAISYPYIEAWLSKDRRMHHAAQQPREAPVRTAVGAAAVTFYLVLALDAAQDIFAENLHLMIEPVVWTGRICAIVLPVGAAVIAYRTCRGRQRRANSDDRGRQTYALAEEGEYRSSGRIRVGVGAAASDQDEEPPG